MLVLVFMDTNAPNVKMKVFIKLEATFHLSSVEIGLRLLRCYYIVRQFSLLIISAVNYMVMKLCE